MASTMGRLCASYSGLYGVTLAFRPESRMIYAFTPTTGMLACVSSSILDDKLLVATSSSFATDEPTANNAAILWYK